MLQRSTIYFLISFLFHFTNSIAQSNCFGLLPFSEGMFLEYTNYDQKNDVSSIVRNEVGSITGNGEDSLAFVSSKIYNKVGILKREEQFSIKCKNSQLSIDLVFTLSPELKNPYTKFDYEVKGTPLVFPIEIRIGQALNIADASVEASIDGIQLPDFQYNSSQRAIVDEKVIITPAGQFQCYQMVHRLKFKAILIKELEITEWFSAGIGLVKSETRTQEGKLIAKTILTTLSK